MHLRWLSLYFINMVVRAHYVLHIKCVPLHINHITLCLCGWTLQISHYVFDSALQEKLVVLEAITFFIIRKNVSSMSYSPLDALS